MFFSFDGIDGAGKSTQIKLFSAWLRELGREVVECRDPGGTALGESLRSILLGNHDTPICATSEMLIYMASRAQLVDEVIRPALNAGKTVVSDRFLVANVVYQGYAFGLQIEHVKQVGAVATNGLQPTMTFILDMDVELAAERMDRSLDRIEARGLGFQERVRQGFLAEAKLRPDFFTVIDATQNIQTIQGQIQSVSTRLFET